MRLLIILAVTMAVAAALSGCAGAYVAGDLGASNSAKRLAPAGTIAN